MKQDLLLGAGSSVLEGDIVLVSYGKYNFDGYDDNLQQDLIGSLNLPSGDYNATLWVKCYTTENLITNNFKDKYGNLYFFPDVSY
jgi:hypothetical protein